MQPTQSKKPSFIRYPDETEAFWMRHWNNFSIIGLARKKYCREQKINYERFTYWIKKSNLLTVSIVDKNKPSLVKSQTLVPIKIKQEIRRSDILCSLVLKNGVILQVHDQSALSCILAEII
jgi:hypothetical protein